MHALCMDCAFTCSLWICECVYLGVLTHACNELGQGSPPSNNMHMHINIFTRLNGKDQESREKKRNIFDSKNIKWRFVLLTPHRHTHAVYSNTGIVSV